MQRGQRRSPQTSRPGQPQRAPQRRPATYRRRRRRSKRPMIFAAVAAIVVILIVIFILILGGEQKAKKTGYEVVTAFSSQIPTVSDVVDYTRETDPNGALGTPGWYVNKTDWTDSRAEGTYTLEVYTDEKKAIERTEYLESFYGSILADYVVYRIDGYVLRLSSKLSPTDIEEYVKLFESQVE